MILLYICGGVALQRLHLVLRYECGYPSSSGVETHGRASLRRPPSPPNRSPPCPPPIAPASLGLGGEGCEWRRRFVFRMRQGVETHGRASLRRPPSPPNRSPSCPPNRFASLGVTAMGAIGGGSEEKAEKSKRNNSDI
jgi:hypothetical protein